MKREILAALNVKGYHQRYSLKHQFFFGKYRL